MEVYLVGGAVRDHYLGIRSKDLDYVVMADSYDEMKDFVVNTLHCSIKVETPQYGVIRAVHPTKGGVDFALPRVDQNCDGRHAEARFVETIEEDLARRDFTMNAIAIEVNENLSVTTNVIDPFGGRHDIESRLIRFVGSPKERIEEDSLRILRAIRFSCTKRFTLDYKAHMAIKEHRLNTSVSNERIMEELNKCFSDVCDNSYVFASLEIHEQLDILDRVKIKITT